MSYEAVVFDSDGVLVEMPSRETLRRATEWTFRNFDLAAGREEMRALFAGNAERIRSLCRKHRIDTMEFYTELGSHTVREQKREFEKGLRSLYDDVKTLRSLDLPFGLVSDNHQTIVEYIVSTFGLEEHFDVVYGRPFTPRGLRRRKPDPYYLNAALSVLGTRDALYVGDSACDVHAAANAGIDSALICRDEDPVECETDPTYEIKSLCALPAIVV